MRGEGAGDLGSVGDPEELEGEAVRAALADRLRDAFASVPRPDPPVTSGAGPMHDDIERALGGKAVDELTAADARAARMNLWLLTPEAYAYYLPALLRLHLVGDTYVDGLGQFTYYSLLPPDSGDAAATFEQRMALLDEQQRQVLADYVRWYLNEEPSASDREAAARYWLR